MNASATNPRQSGPRVLLVKLSSMGDIMHALPVAYAVRARLPQAEIAWVVERRWRELVAGHPAIDRIFTVDTFAARRQLANLMQFRRELAELRKFGAQWALDLQSNWKSALVLAASGAGQRIGFGKGATRERLVWLGYTQRVSPRRAHITEQMLELLDALPGQAVDQGFRIPAPSFQVPAEAREAARRWRAERNIGEFLFLAPGGGWGAKRWPMERYLQVAQALQERWGLAAVINAGPGDGAPAAGLHGFSGSPLELGGLLSDARLVVGGDTGPVHMAAALDRAIVALYGPTHPDRNGPYARRTRVLRKPQPVTHSRHEECAAGLLAIEVDEVVEACSALLQEER